MIGCSASNNDHGGTEQWDGWRCYTQSAYNTYTSRTGLQRPKFIAYSKGGANLGGAIPTYNAVFNEVLNDLNNTYYSPATSQTQSAKWGIYTYWSNGNENYDKGALTLPHTQAKINAYIVSQQALYDAVHYIDPITGQRRFPHALAGSNPTHNAEFDGNVEGWLHQSAPWHDFVMWSSYPPGRNFTTADPRYDWPSLVDADHDNNPEGFMVRTLRRTKLAEAEAGHSLLYCIGEIGIGDDPSDNTTRPYYAVYGLIEPALRLADQYDLAMPFMCWWDNQTDANSAQNILSDEDPGTNPSTRQALQGWKGYNTYRGGTKPASWAGTPRGTWNTTGTPL
jgi:hypothetical protein